MGRRRNHIYYKLQSDLGRRAAQISQARIQVSSTKSLCERLVKFAGGLSDLAASYCGGQNCVCKELIEPLYEFTHSINRMKETIAFCEPILLTEHGRLISGGLELETLMFLRESRIRIKCLSQLQALAGSAKCEVKKVLHPPTSRPGPDMIPARSTNISPDSSHSLIASMVPSPPPTNSASIYLQQFHTELLRDVDNSWLE